MSLKKGVGNVYGFISHRYGSGDPDPHQNVTDTQHYGKVSRRLSSERALAPPERMASAR
jgi:hypothetical protein